MNAPTQMWAEYLPAELRDRAPVLEQTDEGDFEVFEGQRRPLSALTAAAGKRPQEYTMTVRRFEDVRAGGWSPGPRVEDQEADGLDAEVLFGNIAGAPLMTHDRGLARASHSAYNHWLADFCAYAPDRLIGIANVPADDPEDSLAEVRDAAARGLRGAMLPQVPAEGSWGDERWDPLWRELVELGWPANLHVGGATRPATPPAALEGGADQFLNAMVASKLQMSLSLGAIVLSGVLIRHPDLKVVSVEAQIGWIPFWKEYLDHVYEKHRWHRNLHFEERPSFYVDRQVFYTFMEDAAGVAARHACGVDRIMWSSDYPHSETTWPYSQKIIGEILQGVPERERARIVRENCVELYGLS